MHSRMTAFWKDPPESKTLLVINSLYMVCSKTAPGLFSWQNETWMSQNCVYNKGNVVVKKILQTDSISGSCRYVILYFRNMQHSRLNLWCIMSQNGQINFKNLAANAARLLTCLTEAVVRRCSTRAFSTNLQPPPDVDISGIIRLS